MPTTAPGTTPPGRSSRLERGRPDRDWFDYDNDGYLDLFVANFAGQDRLYENSGPPGYTPPTSPRTELPSENKTSLGLDTVDVDHDGDYEVMVTNDNHRPTRSGSTSRRSPTSTPRA